MSLSTLEHFLTKKMGFIDCNCSISAGIGTVGLSRVYFEKNRAFFTQNSHWKFVASLTTSVALTCISRIFSYEEKNRFSQIGMLSICTCANALHLYALFQKSVEDLERDPSITPELLINLSNTMINIGSLLESTLYMIKAVLKK